MKPDDLKELMEQEPEAGPPFMLVPGRWYAAMWSVGIPDQVSRHGKGGDITLMVWRKDDEPRCWHILYRFRHYKNEKVWSGEDTKKWYKLVAENNTQEEAEAGVVAMLSTVSLMSGKPLECLRLNGSSEVFFRLAQSGQLPDWLHMQTQRSE